VQLQCVNGKKKDDWIQRSYQQTMVGGIVVAMNEKFHVKKKDNGWWYSC
jgi:hypothetical protein